MMPPADPPYSAPRTVGCGAHAGARPASSASGSGASLRLRRTRPLPSLTRSCSSKSSALLLVGGWGLRLGDRLLDRLGHRLDRLDDLLLDGLGDRLLDRGRGGDRLLHDRGRDHRRDRCGLHLLDRLLDSGRSDRERRDERRGP